MQVARMIDRKMEVQERIGHVMVEVTVKIDKKMEVAGMD